MLELLETERRYVALLTVLIRQFLKPLLLLTYTDQEQFLTEEEVRYYSMFSSYTTQPNHSSLCAHRCIPSS